MVSKTSRSTSCRSSCSGAVHDLPSTSQAEAFWAEPDTILQPISTTILVNICMKE